MMNASQYEASLRKLNLKVYLFGERVTNVVDHPVIRPSMNAVALTYELAQRPEHEALLPIDAGPDDADTRAGHDQSSSLFSRSSR